MRAASRQALAQQIVPSDARLLRWASAVVGTCLLALTACSPVEEVVEPSVVDVPNCRKIAVFGNGRQCSADDPLMTTCGQAKTKICANGWLCFDGAKLAFCACHVDADCQNRADYINSARATRKIAPIAASCVAGRCAGTP